MTDNSTPDDGEVPKQNTRAVSDIRHVRTTGYLSGAVVTETETFVLDGRRCSCGHMYSFTPIRGEAIATAYDRRRRACCVHQRALLDAKAFGPCEECGGYTYTERRRYHHGRWVLSEFRCAGCGSLFGYD
jgi:hypothetical protein